jgi:hypothetical protein
MRSTGTMRTRLTRRQDARGLDPDVAALRLRRRRENRADDREHRDLVRQWCRLEGCDL